MNSNKLILVVIAVFALTVTSCKKSTTTPKTTSSTTPTVDYIRCKVNGVTHTFDISGSNSNVSNYDNNYPNTPNHKVIQMARLEGGTDVFTIDIYEDLDSLIAPKTFSTSGVSKDLMKHNFSITYLQSFKSYLSWYESDEVKSNSSITITSKENDIIQGTFNGTFYGFDITNFELDSIKITDGEFRVKVVRKSLIP